MKISLPTVHPQWCRAERILQEVSDTDESSISGEDFGDFIFSMHELFSDRSSGRKFEAIPSMLSALPRDVAEQFLHVSFPRMCRDIASELSSRSDPVQASIPCLSCSEATSITFSPGQAYVLLGLSFFCIPLIIDGDTRVSMDATCHLLFSDQPKIVSKLHCLVNYFNVVVAARSGQFPTDVVDAIIGDHRSITLERLVSSDYHGAEWWSYSSCALTSVEYRGNFQRIESAIDEVHADFANKHLGGGVLRKGCVQEEIRFMVSPECLLAVFLCEGMNDNEAVMVRETIQFNAYSGYGSSFRCLGLSTNLLSLFDGESQTLLIDDVLCFDAIPFGPETQKQFRLPFILRELEKCRAALGYEGHKPFATGNWGCGVFGGDTQLKAVIQWLAASVNNKLITYFPFEDDYTKRLPELAQKAAAHNLTVGWIFQNILRGLVTEEIRSSSTIDFLLKQVDGITG